MMFSEAVLKGLGNPCPVWTWAEPYESFDKLKWWEYLLFTQALVSVVVSNEVQLLRSTSLLYLSTFFKYLYFTGVVLFWVTFTFTSLHSKA